MAVSTGSKVFALVTLSVVAGVLFVLTRYVAGGSDAAEGEPVSVTIPEGVAADEVGGILVDAGVLSNALAFQAITRVDQRASQIQPGTYELRAGMETGEILEVLTQAPEAVPVWTITLPEGLTVEQTLQRIADAEDSPFDVDELREALAGVALPAWVPDKLPKDAEPFEGLLSPNTYEFRVDVTAQDLLNELVAETDAHLQDAGVSEDDMYDTLIIASLIEREVRVRDEQTTVSSVIHNRLDDGERLQIDATVLYAKGEAGTRVLTSDTDVDSPWNTYENAGLPPTPIAAPGKGAIQAAAEPADTKYKFYVVCDFDTGQHAFTRSFDKHQRNIARYQEIRDAQSGSYCDEAA